MLSPRCDRTKNCEIMMDERSLSRSRCANSVQSSDCFGFRFRLAYIIISFLPFKSASFSLSTIYRALMLSVCKRRSFTINQNLGAYWLRVKRIGQDLTTVLRCYFLNSSFKILSCEFFLKDKSVFFR